LFIDDVIEYAAQHSEEDRNARIAASSLSRESTMMNLQVRKVGMKTKEREGARREHGRKERNITSEREGPPGPCSIILSYIFKQMSHRGYNYYKK